MTKVTYEIPSAIVLRLQRRCREWNIRPDDLVAAVLLNHLECGATQEDPPLPVLNDYRAWLSGLDGNEPTAIAIELPEPPGLDVHDDDLSHWRPFDRLDGE